MFNAAPGILLWQQHRLRCQSMQSAASWPPAWPPPLHLQEMNNASVAVLQKPVSISMTARPSDETTL